MPRAKISDEDKRRLLRSFQNDEDYQELADQLDINRKTARSIIYRTLRRGGVVSVPRGGKRFQKVDEDMKEKIIALVEENSSITLKSIVEELAQRFPEKPTISETTVRKVLNGELISLKKLHLVPQDRNRDDVKRARQDYASWLLQEGQLSHMVFFDESGYNLWLKRSYGRAREGQRAVRQVYGQRGQNLTFKLAISPRHGVITSSFHFGGTTKEIFAALLNSVISSSIDEAESTFLVMDNAPCHRDASTGNDLHQVKFLPPHSPFLNPFEAAFSSWNAAVKRKLALPQTLALLNQIDGQETKSARKRRILMEIGEDAVRCKR